MIPRPAPLHLRHFTKNDTARVAGTIVRFYTLRAQSLVRDRYREPSSEDLFALICKKYEGLAV
jgi:hypothetical protein